MRMRRARGRFRRRIVRALIGLIALVLLLVAALLVRLSRGPISLDFVTPWVVEALQPADGAFRVSVGATEMVWTERWHDVDLSVRDVAFRDPGGATVASFPELAMELSLGALLHGELAPREIEVVGPHLRLLREPDGSVGLGLGLGREAGDGDGASVVQRLLAGGEDDASDAPAAEWLRKIVVRDGRLGFTDRASGFSTSAADVAIDVHRKPTGLEVALAADLEIGATRIPVRLQVS
ncbi:MAG: hypothetical protein AB1689_21420, partial [Thermodesulfobacteriota bacterium]